MALPKVCLITVFNYMCVLVHNRNVTGARLAEKVTNFNMRGCGLHT